MNDVVSRPRTLVEKIVAAHRARGPHDPRPGDFLSLRPRHVLTHDNSAAVLSKFEGLGAGRVHDPEQPVFVLDHDIQNRSEENQAKYARIEAFARAQGIDFHPAGTGIGHQVMVSRGYVVPGSLCVASDSHANTYGALGALGTPVVRTDAAAIWATGEFWWQVPPVVKVDLVGELPEGVTGKDLILALCGSHPDTVLNRVVEFVGEGVASLSMDARMSVANMTTEWGALAGVFPVDGRTVDFLRGVLERARGDGRTPFDEAQLEAWAQSPPAADEGAVYEAHLRVHLDSLTPTVAGPDVVQAAHPLRELAGAGVRIDKAYLLSCVNGRLEDLRQAAAVLKGRRVAAHVDLYLAAASRDVQEAAEAEGTWQTLVEAGAHVLPPGCGPCIGLGEGLLEPGEIAISATNRNFKGRMGSREAQAYLASPAVVAASAAAGVITGPEGLSLEGAGLRTELERSASVEATAAPSEAEVEILEGFPAEHTGRYLFVPVDNLNTDGIYGKDHTYRELTPQEMARAVMANHDPRFAEIVREGDVLVGGWNFGTGSSREQAATALAAAGIRLVVAGSFSQTYLRNAFNNGFPCVVCPALMEHLRTVHADAVAEGRPTIIGETPLHIDFRRGRIEVGGRFFAFSPLGEVPQSLIVAGGLENQVRARLRS